MRCPKCNQELNPHSERCPNCGTSARYAVPDGDTMTRVRRHISVIQRENEVSGAELPDASFSPVLKFDRPAASERERAERAETADRIIDHNPADNFPDESFDPVDLSGMIPSGSDDDRHRELSESIRRMVRNKEDDLLAEYYFKDGISDLERIQLARSYEKLNNSAGQSGGAAETSARGEEQDTPDGGEAGMSEAAKRLSEFPEEKGLDKILTSLWEKYDAAVLKVRNFFRVKVAGGCRRLYDRFDARTSGFMNGMLDRFYYGKFGATKRKRADSADEGYRLRRRIWAVAGILAVLLVGGLLVFRIMTASDINGKWIISTDSSGNPNIIMEFKPGGRAAVSVKSGDGWHVHKQGRYTTNRKNGHDMLTIMYEDGDVRRLYYIIDGKSATFINVDTNVQVVYHLK